MFEAWIEGAGSKVEPSGFRIKWWQPANFFIAAIH